MPIYKQVDRLTPAINTALQRTDLIPNLTGRTSTLEANMAKVQTGVTALSGQTAVLEDRMGQTIDHGTGETAGYTLTDNDTHVWGVVGSLDISSLENPTGGTYMVIFDSGETATTLTLPSNVIWNADVDISANKRYCLGIIRGLGFFNEFDPGTPVT